MQPFQTIIISGLTVMFMQTFGSIATFLVNRYAPKIFDHVDKHIKKIKKQEK